MMSAYSYNRLFPSPSKQERAPPRPLSPISPTSIPANFFNGRCSPPSEFESGSGTETETDGSRVVTGTGTGIRTRPKTGTAPTPPRAPLRDRANANNRLFITAPPPTPRNVRPYSDSAPRTHSRAIRTPYPRPVRNHDRSPIPSTPSSGPSFLSPRPAPPPPALLSPFTLRVPHASTSTQSQASSPTIPWASAPASRAPTPAPAPAPAPAAPLSRHNNPHFARIAPDLYLTHLVPGHPPPSMLWTDVSWGAWQTRDATHRVVLLAHEDAVVATQAPERRGVHERVVSAGPGAGSVRELLLVLRADAGAGLGVRLESWQLDRAVEFLERAHACSAFEDSEDGSVRTASTWSGGVRARCALVCCPPGYEADAVAVAVGFMGGWERRGVPDVVRGVDANPEVGEEWRDVLGEQDVQFIARAVGVGGVYV
ncbi:hypothetical protein DENSPDRAFT_884406 [Dentipellis sp. KUC8613]|nr:hypothetical protein DENSPDRAFT_884406 [Dentipellis sp. KUC8613]